MLLDTHGDSTCTLRLQPSLVPNLLHGLDPRPVVAVIVADRPSHDALGGHELRGALVERQERLGVALPCGRVARRGGRLRRRVPEDDLVRGDLDLERLAVPLDRVPRLKRGHVLGGILAKRDEVVVELRCYPADIVHDGGVDHGYVAVVRALLEVVQLTGIEAGRLGCHRDELALGVKLLEDLAEGREQRSGQAALDVDVDAVEAVLLLDLRVPLDEAVHKRVLELLALFRGSGFRHCATGGMVHSLVTKPRTCWPVRGRVGGRRKRTVRSRTGRAAKRENVPPRINGHASLFGDVRLGRRTLVLVRVGGEVAVVSVGRAHVGVHLEVTIQGELVAEGDADHIVALLQRIGN
eukprot:scaffold21979_cov66-Phaeocystis_antarctica.AAC.7